MNENLRSHIIELFKSDLRIDGRKLTQYRPITVETGVIKMAEGSARVKIGETEVIVGVKVELGKPYPDMPDAGTIMVGAELLPLSSPNFELGPPSIEAIELARVVDRGIRESKTLDFKKLCIKKGEQVWILLIDICTINDAGNLPDASSLAALAALRDMRFPKVNGDTVNYQEKTNKKLDLKNSPIAVTVVKIGDKLIVDPSTEEKEALDARLTVASLEDGTLCAMQKGGDTALTAEDISKMVDLGLEKGKELRKLL
ncbi:exosome complex protein Rrp42 [Candidatus Woesearchaeota archaeon]|nr:exosome complex protein Rrp42 [Candidatus Woesearchaeota archaeon]